MKLALFGGTFDPVHNGHLSMAREAVEQCALDRVLFIPAGRPPHKAAGPRAAYADRFQMVKLACARDPRFEASRLEEADRKSFSIDTIEKVRADLGTGDQLYFLIGADAFGEIETWWRWHDVVREVEFLVVSRPGARYAIPQGTRVTRLDKLELPTSSSEIRRRLATGNFDVDVPADVLDYIRMHGLYAKDV